MSDEECNLSLTIFIFKLLIELANFIWVCIIVDSSKENPFESHIIGNLSNYFNDAGNNAIPYNNDLINNTSTEEYIGNDNNTSGPDTKMELFLRKLISKSSCLEIRDNFEKFKGRRLSFVFDLNFDKILKTSIATLVLYLVLFVFLIINGCLVKAKIYYREYKCFVIF